MPVLRKGMAINCTDKPSFHYMPEGMMTFERFPGWINLSGSSLWRDQNP